MDEYMKQICIKAGHLPEETSKQKSDKKQTKQMAERIVQEHLSKQPPNLATSVDPFFLTKMKGIDYDKVQKYREILKKKMKSFDGKAKDLRPDIKSDNGCAGIDSDDFS